jgi:phospholipid/cholesterol/gamma-HCH transport system ATP-binding protein
MTATEMACAGGEVLVQADGVTIGWGDLVLARDVSFLVRRGEVFAILGGSGSGKSTLLRYLIGLTAPPAGTIDVCGGKPSLRADAPRFGMAFQSGALFGSRTIGENVALALRAWTDLDSHAIDEVVRSKLHLVGLEGFQNYLPAELSGGMRKRAAIARALALDPDLLFLDEPSAGLDPVTADALDELLLTLRRALGLTVVLVTHELASVFKVVDRCLFIDARSRSVLAQGDPRVLRDERTDPVVRAFFNRDSKGAPLP